MAAYRTGQDRGISLMECRLGRVRENYAKEQEKTQGKETARRAKEKETIYLYTATASSWHWEKGQMNLRIKP